MGRRPPNAPQVNATNAIVQLLEKQADAWNDGDLDAFMEGYWHSPKLTFSSGGRTTRGWQSTLDGYRSRYPSRAKMGHLSFTDIEVQSIKEKAALVLGRWSLKRDKPVGGNFTLILRKVGGKWRIIHDHTSRSPS